MNSATTVSQATRNPRDRQSHIDRINGEGNPAYIPGAADAKFVTVPMTAPVISHENDLPIRRRRGRPRR